MQLPILRGGIVAARVLSHDEVLSVARRFAKDANRIFPTATVVLFGSYSQGTAEPESDVDIAILFDEIPIKDAKELLDKRLELTLVVADNYDEDIQVAFRLFDDPSGFVDTILETGILIADPHNQLARILNN